MSNRTKIVAIPKTTTTIFSPTSITGCSLWLDGADATTFTFSSGSNISVWRDKSANSSNATPYGSGTNVTYSSSVKAVYFPGSSGLQTSVITPTNRVGSGFFVVKVTNPSGNVIFQGSCCSDGGRQFRNDSGTTLRTVKENVVDMFFSGPTVNNTLMLVGYVDDGTNLTHCVNGTLYSTTLATTFSSGRTVLIGYSQNGEYLIGNIHEVVLFNTSLNTTDRQTIEAYLAQKWGLTSSLAAGHPGLTTTVYTITAALPKQKISSIPKTITASFSPTSITGCSLWLDGADPAGTGIVPASGNLATWVDKSGGGINAIAGTSVYPQFTTSYLNGLGVVGLTNASDYFTVANNFNTPSLAYIFVMKPTAANTGGYCAILSTDTPSAYGRSIALNNMNFQFEYYSNFTNTSITTNTTTWYIVSLVFNGTSSITLSYNGTISTYGGSGTGTNTNGLTIGSYNNTSSYTTFNANFYLAEAIVYTSSLTQTQFQTVESYLAQKWGLTSNLVAGHPGLTTTVYGTVAPTVRQKIGYIPFIPLAQYIQAFTYTGSNQTFTVPSRTTSITLYMWGAGGGGNTNYGGAGAMVQGVLSVTPGESLTIVVGQGGTIDGTTTFGGGGAGAGNMAFGGDPGIGYSGNGSPQNAGSGGGRSAIQRGGTDPTNDIVVAGGGGGGTYFSSDRGGAATFSGTANPGIGGLPGLGGTQSAGGAGGGTGQYGQGLGGSRGIGGNTYNTNIFNGGGGGGGGYYGGGGGGTNGGDGAGGGGGSSLTSTLSLISGQSVLGFNSTNGFTAPNNTSPYYVSGVGNGAPAISSNPRAGGNGRVVLVYMA